MLTQISLQESSIAVKYKAFDTEACRGVGGGGAGRGSNEWLDGRKQLYISIEKSCMMYTPSNISDLHSIDRDPVL